VTVAIRKIVGKEAPAIVKKLCEDAKAGDRMAASLVMRLLPKSRIAEAISFDMPVINDATDLPGAVQKIIAAVADGQLTPGEGQALVGMYEGLGRVITASTYEERIKALETQLFNRNREADDVPIDGATTAH
jgi:hypothetical protein